MTSTSSPSTAGEQLRPPFAYYGGKTKVAARIVELLPEHRHYVEPFAGSLAVLLAKPRARMETVNDLDGDLMTMWRVLRDRPAEFARVCALTPHSRAEHEASYGDLSGLADLERARRVWVRIAQGRTGTLRRTGWRHIVDPDSSGSSMGRYLTGYVERMAPVAERLSEVALEDRPALDLIERYGRHRSVLLYVDPPYLGSERTRNYRHEMMSEASHRDLAAVLRSVRATAVISGYASPLYDEDLYPDWHRYTLDTGTSQGGAWSARTEVLWSNRPLTRDVPLFGPGNETPAIDGAGNETRCPAPGCGLPVHQPVTGRRRIYCSDSCRVAAHKTNRRLSVSGGTPSPTPTRRAAI